MQTDLRQEVIDRVPLVEEIRRHVNLKAAGREYMGCCPFHQEKTPSFTVNETKGFYHCFGCGAHGNVIDFYMSLHGMDFKEALQNLAGIAGLIPVNGEQKRPKKKKIKRIDDKQVERDRQKKIIWAQKKWKSSLQGQGTLINRYFESRGIHLPVPPSIRFRAFEKHTESKQEWPCMIAAVQQPDGTITGVHRTFLTPDGSGKADVKSVKKMMGVCYRGCVRLAHPAKVMGIAEGIESGLSVMQTFPDLPVWICLTMDNMTFFTVPDGVEEVVILADADTKDRHKGKRRMEETAQNIIAQGAKARIAWPPDGKDFNDMLKEQAL